MTKLGRNIKHLRSKKKYSQSELASILGVSQTSIAHYEAGTRQPTIETLIELSRIFDKSIDTLVGHSLQISENKELLKDQNKLTNSLIKALINKDEKEFFDVFENNIMNQLNISVVIDKILKDVLYEVGTLWEQGKITEADEHYATNIVRKAMSCFSLKAKEVIKNKKAITFSVSSEKHTLGIEMINAYLETLGVNSLYLGSNVPVKSLLQLIDEYQPEYIFISITISDHMNGLVQLVDTLNEKYGSNLLIGIGGQGIMNDQTIKQYKNVIHIKDLDKLKEVIQA